MDTIANDGPVAAVFVGIASVVLAGLKLWVLRRYIRLRLGRFLAAGAGVVLTWNFCMSPIMAFVVRHAHERAVAVRNTYLVGWLAMLAGGALMLLHAAVTTTGAAHRRDKETPFLRTQGMAWVFSLILLCAANVHQCALGFLFDIHIRFGDFLPMVSLATVLSVEVMRSFGKKFGEEEIVVALLPLAAIVFTALTGSFSEDFSFGVGLLWYPPVLMGVTGMGLFWISCRDRWGKVRYVAWAYALGIMLTARVTPGVQNALDWESFGYALAVALSIMGIVLRNVTLAMGGVAALSAMVGLSNGVRGFAREQSLPIPGLMGIAAGLGTLTTYLLSGKRLPRGIALLGALVLALSTVACFGLAAGPPKFYDPLASGAAVGFLSGLVWLRK
jgi:hypothetical protein